MTTDDSLHQSRMSQVIQPSRFPVALSGRVKQREVPRLTSFQKAIFDRRRESFRMSSPDEASTHDRLSWLDQCRCVVGRAKKSIES